MGTIPTGKRGGNIENTGVHDIRVFPGHIQNSVQLFWKPGGRGRYHAGGDIKTPYC